jgi:SAM-dependent methyltransferase
MARAEAVAPGGQSRADWTVIRRLAAAWLRDPVQFSRVKLPRDCPMCGYHGLFISVGRPSRWDSRCPKCASRERHRLMQLWMNANGGNPFAGKRILHFAPEKAVRRLMKGNPLYETADLHQRGVTHAMDITAIPSADASYDVVIAHHVLEHIDDDHMAMSEVFRIIEPGGFALLSVPLNGTREATYDNSAIISPYARFYHFGGYDHKRYYGLDFSKKLEAVGFTVEIFRAPQDQEIRYALLPEEWIYVARKPA